MANLTDVQRVPLASIDPNPNNPRSEFDEGKLAALADSFAANGGRPFTPLLVVADGERYMIVDGERRYRAMVMAGEVDSADVVVADDADAAYAMAGMLATDSKERLTDEERAVGTQQMLMLGVEPDVVDKTAGLERGSAARIRPLLSGKRKPMQTTLDALFQIADIEDPMERSELVAMAASGDGGFSKHLRECQGRQRRAADRAKLLAFLDERGIEPAETHGEGMRRADYWYVCHLGSTGRLDERTEESVVTITPEDWEKDPMIELWEPAVQGEAQEDPEVEQRRQEFDKETEELGMAHIEYIVEVLDEKPELASVDLMAFVLERFTDTYNVREFTDLGFDFDGDDVCVAMLPFCSGKLRSNASSSIVRKVYGRGGIASEYEVDYVRDWVRIYDMLVTSGYASSDFECHCRGALREALAAWDAEHAQEAGGGEGA